MSNDKKCIALLKDHPQLQKYSEEMENRIALAKEWATDMERQITERMTQERLDSIAVFAKIDEYLVEANLMPKDAPSPDHINIHMHHGDAVYYSIRRVPQTRAENEAAARQERWTITREDTTAAGLLKRLLSL